MEFDLYVVYRRKLLKERVMEEDQIWVLELFLQLQGGKWIEGVKDGGGKFDRKLFGYLGEVGE